MKIIGITTKTTNDNGKSAEDLGRLWERFYTENILDKIENKINSNIYSIYTDYKSDYSEEYTTMIGVEVSSLENIPDGLEGRKFPEQKFEKFFAVGPMPNAVAETWKLIWEKDAELNRAYTYDYELYTEKSQKGDNSEVDIFIAVKN